MGPKKFFPGRNENSDAKEVCARCPVRVECLEHALTAREQFGIWGGLGERSRRKLRHTGIEAVADAG
jgi:WhiB family redox-sensing transcriptional regulator